MRSHDLWPISSCPTSLWALLLLFLSVLFLSDLSWKPQRTWTIVGQQSWWSLTILPIHVIIVLLLVPTAGVRLKVASQIISVGRNILRTAIFECDVIDRNVRRANRKNGRQADEHELENVENNILFENPTRVIECRSAVGWLRRGMNAKKTTF